VFVLHSILSTFTDFKKRAVNNPGIAKNTRGLSPKLLTTGIDTIGVNVAAKPPIVIKTDKDFPLDTEDRFAAIDDPSG